VFQLEVPTQARPFIPKLLDPCSDSKVTPNIPAEKLYDASDDGLCAKNSWEGMWVLLNPPFTSKVQIVPQTVHGGSSSFASFRSLPPCLLCVPQVPCTTSTFCTYTRVPFVGMACVAFKQYVELNLLKKGTGVQFQWRWINRAIDEVESGRVPGIILLCRNSTDTEFFQRLRPYPRVYLLASNVHFREFDNTPNGFGVVLVCITPFQRMDMHERFLLTFEHYGEASTAVDGSLGRSTMQMLLSRCATASTRCCLHFSEICASSRSARNMLQQQVHEAALVLKLRQTLLIAW
jgi:hypothetical protein